ncbi:MAG: hypothetical protein AAF487_15295, partial [Bacteroidota bacterium]
MARSKSKAINKAKASNRNKSKSSKKTKSFQLSILKNKNFHQGVAFFLILMGLFSFFAFASFLFNWQEDQSLIIGSEWSMNDNTVLAKNALGKYGAYIGHFFPHCLSSLKSVLGKLPQLSYIPRCHFHQLSCCISRRCCSPTNC